MIWCHVLSHLVSVEDFIVRTSYLLSVVALPVLAACSDRTTATSPLAPNGAALHAGKPGSPTDPTATWIYPLNDAALAVRSDHLYSDGTNSVYADGVCNISTTIFATTARSNSGDATLNTGANGRCIRHFTFAYPDGYSETLPSFNNLRMIENSTYSIPIGATVERQLHMGSDAISNVASRCGGLVWGYGVQNNIAAGSDSVLVTRVDASTWHVVSQPAPHNLAWCKTTGQLFAMPVEFTVVSSRPLP